MSEFFPDQNDIQVKKHIGIKTIIPNLDDKGNIKTKNNYAVVTKNTVVTIFHPDLVSMWINDSIEGARLRLAMAGRHQKLNNYDTTVKFASKSMRKPRTEKKLSISTSMSSQLGSELEKLE